MRRLRDRAAAGALPRPAACLRSVWAPKHRQHGAHRSSRCGHRSGRSAGQGGVRDRQRYSAGGGGNASGGGSNRVGRRGSAGWGCGPTRGAVRPQVSDHASPGEAWPWKRALPRQLNVQVEREAPAAGRGVVQDGTRLRAPKIGQAGPQRARTGSAATVSTFCVTVIAAGCCVVAGSWSS